jgi:GT2 family glycosyltransferase
VRTSAVGWLTRQTPSYVTTIELTQSSHDIRDLARYHAVYALVTIRGRPVGVVTQPVVDGCCSGKSLRRAALDRLRGPIIRQLLAARLENGVAAGASGLVACTAPPPSSSQSPHISVAVAVCTRDRLSDLARCLDALKSLIPAPDEILVVDNAPANDAAAQLVARYQGINYVRESRPGLNWARSRAVLETQSDVIAFADDDVVVARGWIEALRRAFSDPVVGVVTGLVLPLELETDAQLLFEHYGGFGRGFERVWHHVDSASGEHAATLYAGPGKLGTGANMAFRRSVLDDAGLFDPALDVGTVTNGGGDLEMFYRVLDRGYLLLYEPAAYVWHRHRRSYADLRRQLRDHGIGFYSFLMARVLYWRDDRWTLLRFGAAWLWRWSIRRLLQVLYKPGLFPLDLVVAELRGSLQGLFRYPRAARQSAVIAAQFAEPALPPLRRTRRERSVTDRATRRGTRQVEITRAVTGMPDVAGYAETVIVVTHDTRKVGELTIANKHQRLSACRVRDAIVQHLGLSLIDCEDADPSAVDARLRSLFPDANRPPVRHLDSAFDVSIVLATRDRPDDLRAALRSIAAVQRSRHLEVIVVDNNPESGTTPPIVAEFPGVRPIAEPRPGLSYARNAGIGASRGAIVITTDDDVIVDENWVEELIAPFADPDVMVVTGNVLALDLSRESQRLFEAYGGLGRGPRRRAVDGEWFWAFRKSVPTWLLGGTANAAFRAAIFADPRIGMLNEALGAGSPAGCSEDTDLFYRVLRAGFRLVYQPTALVWHRHRADMAGLRRQIFAYAKGHVASQLWTLTRDRDWRALVRLFVELPSVYWWRLCSRLQGQSPYPLSLVMLEIGGTVAGPWAWWQALRRMKRLGAGARYVPVGERAHDVQAQSTRVQNRPGQYPLEVLDSLAKETSR